MTKASIPDTHVATSIQKVAAKLVTVLALAVPASCLVACVGTPEEEAVTSAAATLASDAGDAGTADADASTGGYFIPPRTSEEPPCGGRGGWISRSRVATAPLESWCREGTCPPGQLCMLANSPSESGSGAFVRYECGCFSGPFTLPPPVYLLD